MTAGQLIKNKNFIITYLNILKYFFKLKLGYFMTLKKSFFGTIIVYRGLIYKNVYFHYTHEIEIYSHFSSFLANGLFNSCKNSDFSLKLLALNNLEKAARAPNETQPTQATGKLRSKNIK